MKRVTINVLAFSLVKENYIGSLNNYDRFKHAYKIRALYKFLKRDNDAYISPERINKVLDKANEINETQGQTNEKDA